MNDKTSSYIAKIDALPSLRKLVEVMDLRARKSLGQNFLFDLNLTRKIARSAGSLDGTTIEIGPGPGGLTRALLLEGAQHVYAIEKDKRAIEALSGLVSAADDHLTLIEDDATHHPIWELGTVPRRVIANLPYNIATNLLVSWLGHASAFESLTLMFQREVAERIIAPVGSPAYGRLSVLATLYADCDILFDIPPEAFVPAPKVVSSVIQIVPLKAPRFACDPTSLAEVTRLAFGQRRKMLRGSLKPIGGTALIEQAGLDPEKRPQDLGVAEFCALANCYDAAQKARNQ